MVKCTELGVYGAVQTCSGEKERKKVTSQAMLTYVLYCGRRACIQRVRRNYHTQQILLYSLIWSMLLW